MIACDYYAVVICDSFVAIYKTLASHGTGNDAPGALGEEGIRAGAADPRPGGRYPTTMSTDTTAGLKAGHTQTESSGTNTIVADLQCGGWGGWDARDVLAGRLDDATVRQAVEVRR